MEAPQGRALAGRLARLVERGGPIPVSLFMAYANAHYYATRDPLGVDGDFITAPEISQVFGELVGLWCADMIMRSGDAGPVALVELGPGRGTLMADVLRALARFGVMAEPHMVETSPVLRDLQAAAVPLARFHDDGTTLPTDQPLVVIANEFFDALPIRQLVRAPSGWRERMVDINDGQFSFVVGDVAMDGAVPVELVDAPDGAILESSPASVAVARDLCDSIARQGGALLVIDYGYAKLSTGETLQAVSNHQFATVLDEPGTCDLTAHVDFGAIGAVASAAGLTVAGPVGQGAFLRRLGLDERTGALAAKHPGRAQALSIERDRLANADQMGMLFKVLAMVALGWPAPEGFGG